MGETLATGGAVDRASISDGGVRITGPGHIALVTRLKPGWLLVTERGAQTPATRAALIREVESEMKVAAPVTIYVDIRNANRMDAEGRDAWGQFGKRRRGDVRKVIVLVRSKLVEMAFSVMGMFVGGGVIRVVAREDELLAEIRRDVPSFKTLPVFPP
jgi:hypothetical protein